MNKAKQNYNGAQDTYRLCVFELSEHVLAQRAVVGEDPVDALEIQDVSLQLAERLAVKAVVVLLEVVVDHLVGGLEVGGVLAHLLDEDLLVEGLRHDQRVVPGPERLLVDLAECPERQNTHATHLSWNT